MALIGLPFYVCPSQSFDLQVRFALAFFTKKREFPSREEMFADLEKDKEQRRKKGLTNRLAHAMGDKQVSHIFNIITIWEYDYSSYEIIN